MQNEILKNNFQELSVKAKGMEWQQKRRQQEMRHILGEWAHTFLLIYNNTKIPAMLYNLVVCTNWNETECENLNKYKMKNLNKYTFEKFTETTKINTLLGNIN